MLEDLGKHRQVVISCSANREGANVLLGAAVVSWGLPLAEALQGAATHRRQISTQSSTTVLMFWEEEGTGFLPGKSASYFCFLFSSFVHSQGLGSKKKLGVSSSRTILLVAEGLLVGFVSASSQR